MVLLTAREHYLCHWLLVKRNKIGSAARNKMLKAWFMMSASGNNPRPKIQSMRDYAKYRNEISSIMSEAQSGKKNSQYGKHWYTNRDTGESKRLKIAPNEKWILGRNIFHGESWKINFMFIEQEKEKELKKWTYEKWDEYHSTDLKNITEFGTIITEVTWVTITNRFKRFIPLYNKLSKQGRHFSANKDLIGKYE